MAYAQIYKAPESICINAWKWVAIGPGPQTERPEFEETV